MGLRIVQDEWKVLLMNRPKIIKQSKLERATGIEPATSSLGS